ncbi:carbohydrate ABC transporter permease [Agathobacter sp.]
MKKSGGKAVRYNKWGYIFLIPFIVVYVVFQLVPLVNTIYNSFFENYMSGLKQIGPTFVGFENYKALFTSGDIWVYFKNTMVMWIMCFIPQIILSLLLGAWFSDVSLKLKGTRFFKTVIYLPNLIMASAFSLLFFTLFADSGPINSLLMQIGFISEPYKFLSHAGSARGLIALMNCLMWFGNTTILLMAGMMGIDTSLFEAAEVDGATSTQVFYKITLPLLRPILVYVVITSLIGGLQLFDVPQILTNGTGDPMRSTMTLIMYLNKHLYSKNYGMAGALSVVLFILTGILSLAVFKLSGNDKRKG